MRVSLTLGLALLVAAGGCGPKQSDPPPRRREARGQPPVRQADPALKTLRARVEQWRSALDKATPKNRVSLKALVKDLALAPGLKTRCGGSSTNFVTVLGPDWAGGEPPLPALLAMPFGEADPGDTADCLVSLVRAEGKLKLVAGVVKLPPTDSKATILESARWTRQGRCHVLTLTWKRPKGGQDEEDSPKSDNYREVSFLSYQGHGLAFGGRFVLRSKGALKNSSVFRNTETTVRWSSVGGRPQLEVSTRQEDTDPTDGSTRKKKTRVVKQLTTDCAFKSVVAAPAERRRPAR